MKEIKALNNLVGKFQKQQQSDEVSEMTESKASQGSKSGQSKTKTKETAPRGWGFAMFEKCIQPSLNLANVSTDMTNEVCQVLGHFVS